MLRLGIFQNFCLLVGMSKVRYYGRLMSDMPVVNCLIQKTSTTPPGSFQPNFTQMFLEYNSMKLFKELYFMRNAGCHGDQMETL